MTSEALHCGALMSCWGKSHQLDLSEWSLNMDEAQCPSRRLFGRIFLWIKRKNHHGSFLNRGKKWCNPCITLPSTVNRKHADIIRMLIMHHSLKITWKDFLDRLKRYSTLPSASLVHHLLDRFVWRNEDTVTWILNIHIEFDLSLSPDWFLS